MIHLKFTILGIVVLAALVTPSLAGATGRWSGYVDVAAQNEAFTGVQAEFIVPSLDCKHTSEGPGRWGDGVTFWVGLDGGLTNPKSPVEQTGIYESCRGSGNQIKPGYHVFTEMYPAPPVFYDHFQGGNYQVRPGDLLVASVNLNTYAGYPGFFLEVQDKTQGWTVAEPDPFPCSAENVQSIAPCIRNTAEVITERLGTPIRLTNYGSINYFNAYVTMNHHSTSLSTRKGEYREVKHRMQAYNENSNVFRYVSPLGQRGSAFSTAFHLG